MSAREEELLELYESVKKLPKLPGVYLMRDMEGDIIYIGKARDLRARVKSYFLGGDGRLQITFLLRRIKSIDKILTEDEEQALVLERDLINKYKPRYNIRLKDDKAYINVRIDKNADWPRLELTRRVENDGATYFGPYTSNYKLYGLLEVIRKVVPLRSCSDTVFYNRQRPCLEYQIKRCAGPCCLPVEREQYSEWVSQAISMLQGKLTGVIEGLTTRMDEAAAELNFEQAAVIRDRIAALVEYAEGAKYVQHHAESRDVFALYREGALATLCIMFVRSGRISGSENFSFSDVCVPDSEILESAVTQFYSREREIPAEIIVPIEFPEQQILLATISKRRGAKVELIVPKRGSRLRLLELALVNAEHGFAAKFNADQRYQEIAKELSLRFRLKQIPRRIECIDISNLQGTDTVGAVVCFFDGHPAKENYKRYRIRQNQGKPDDFLAIQEVVERRLDRGGDDHGLPDLLIIDGGAGQLRKALAARESLGVSIDIIALAKERVLPRPTRKFSDFKPERVYTDPSQEPVLLKRDDPITHFLARVRDEAHRFVISYHRARRSKRVFSSILDEITGLGPERRRRLMKHYGSIEEIKKADTAELAKIGRMPGTLAEKVKNTLLKAP